MILKKKDCTGKRKSAAYSTKQQKSPVEKPKSTQEIINKKNNQPVKGRDINQPNINFTNKRVITPKTHNAQPIPKNPPVNKSPLNNQAPKTKENTKVIPPQHVELQKKEKKEL